MSQSPHRGALLPVAGILGGIVLLAVAVLSVARGDWSKGVTPAAIGVILAVASIVLGHRSRR